MREAEGCKVAEDGSRIGRLLLLSAGFVIGSSPTGETGDCGGASPRLETRLSNERVMPDLERWWLPLLLGGVESVVLRAGRCRCGLGERRSDMNEVWVVGRAEACEEEE